MNSFDAIIIGGGPGGSAAAKTLANAGKNVALISLELGGECLNYGCIPTKSFLWTAELFEKISSAQSCGIDIGEAKINWQRMKERRREVVLKLQKNLKFSLEKAGVKIVPGFGRILDKNTVEVKSESGVLTLKTEFIILATGGKTSFPPGFESNGKILDNHSILELDQPPKTLLIIGGGAVGVEFASIFSALGTQVSIAEKAESLLSREDPDIGAELERIFVRKNIKILKKTVITLEQISSYEKTLVAIGRRPSFSSETMESLGIRSNKSGIETNDFLQTSVPNIFAVGDLAGKCLLAYTADREGEMAAKFILGKNPEPLNYDAVPNTIFCIPEVSSVGIKEDEAKRKNIDYVVGKALFSANSKALIVSSRDGLAKIIVEKASRKILGAHIIGEKASELIAEASLALNAGMTIDFFAKNIHGHPILGEVLKEAADAIFTKL